MKMFKYSLFDSILLLLSLIQAVVTIVLATSWENVSLLGALGSFALLVLMITYNIIVISHLFTHTSWFHSPWLNALVSMLNSFNIGQSVQLYQLTHVRNHHRYNNDQKGGDGKTQDTSSTFQDGSSGEHATLFQYAFIGAAWSVIRLWRVVNTKRDLQELLSRSPARRNVELRQIVLDRIACCLGLCMFLVISWQWTILCYLPAYYLALALVNVQNYYEHYGAMPGEPAANSVSYYGRLYNWLAFNDGYHQEHHLRPSSHWSTMPNVRHTHRDELERTTRIISPVPAILGFFFFLRAMLHRTPREEIV